LRPRTIKLPAVYPYDCLASRQGARPHHSCGHAFHRRRVDWI